jgi:hypothetical protein
LRLICGRAALRLYRRRTASAFIRVATIARTNIRRPRLGRR